MKKFTIQLVLLISLITSAIIFSQTIPQTISYQGILKDGFGVVVANGDYELTFKLYDVEANGSELWTETKTLTVTDGIVNTLLGSSTPVDLPFNKEYWLGVKVGTESELTPRIKLSSVPYSYMSMNVPDGSITAEKIKNGEVVKSINSLTDEVTLVAGSNVSITPSGNNLTISSTGSSDGLTLPFSGNVTTTGAGDNAFEIKNDGSVTGTTAIKGTVTSTTVANTWGVVGDTYSGSGIGVFGAANSETGNNYGVLGRSKSASGVGIYGFAMATTGTNYGVYGTTNSTSGYSGYFTGGRFHINGLVGIGTSNPTYTLDINSEYTCSQRIKSDAGQAVLILERGVATTYSSVFFRTLGSTNYYLGLLGGDNFRISTSSTSLNGLQVSPSGDVNVSDNLFVSGSIGLGITTAPAYKIDAAGSVNLNKGITTGIALRCNGDEAIWYNGTYFSWGYAGSYNFFGNKLKIGGNGNVAPAYTLYVDGTAAKSSAGTAWIVSSDQRLKNILGNYDKGLNEIVELQPVKFRYKENNLRNLPTDNEEVGFIAQDVQKVFPEAVTEAADGYLDFNIHSINVALVNAVKQLKAENDELKARLEKIEKYLSQTAMK